MRFAMTMNVKLLPILRQRGMIARSLCRSQSIDRQVLPIHVKPRLVQTEYFAEKSRLLRNARVRRLYPATMSVRFYAKNFNRNPPRQADFVLP